LGWMHRSSCSFTSSCRVWIWHVGWGKSWLNSVKRLQLV
jgi:hypothetical protein